jgi:hypothetical protein
MNNIEMLKAGLEILIELGAKDTWADENTIGIVGNVLVDARSEKALLKLNWFYSPQHRGWITFV